MMKVLDWLVENVFPSVAVIGVGLMLVFLILLPFIVIADGQKRDSLMEQCKADGRAE